MKATSTLSILFSLLASAAAFAPSTLPTQNVGSKYFRVAAASKTTENDDSVDDNSNQESQRRDFLSTSAAVLLGGIVGTASIHTRPASAAEKPKVVVLGGSGFVGSQVVKNLEDLGISVVATSRDGRLGTVALDFTKDSPAVIQQKVKEMAQGSTAIVSCIGAIGTPDDEVVNSGTGYAAKAAKEAGVDRFVYISVAPEVKKFAKDIDFLKGYMAGKSFSMESIISNAKQYTLIEPTFIYGGDEFQVNPPRVASFYGSFVEGVLSSGPLRALTNIAPEGFIKIALEPPVSVESVAKAAVAGALGKSDLTVLDTYDKIQQTAKLL